MVGVAEVGSNADSGVAGVVAVVVDSDVATELLDRSTVDDELADGCCCLGFRGSDDADCTSSESDRSGSSDVSGGFGEEVDHGVEGCCGVLYPDEFNMAAECCTCQHPGTLS